MLSTWYNWSFLTLPTHTLIIYITTNLDLQWKLYWKFKRITQSPYLLHYLVPWTFLLIHGSSLIINRISINLGISFAKNSLVLLTKHKNKTRTFIITLELISQHSFLKSFPIVVTNLMDLWHYYHRHNNECIHTSRNPILYPYEATCLAFAIRYNILDLASI